MNNRKAILLKAAYDMLSMSSLPQEYGSLTPLDTLMTDIEHELGLDDEGTRDETPDDWRDAKHNRGER